MTPPIPALSALIVDDDPVVRHILGAILKSLSVIFEAVASGEECLQRIDALKSTGSPLPSILFLDLQLQDQTGIEVLNNIRETIAPAELPVAMLSANSEDELRSMHLTHQPEYYLEKPFTADKVAPIISGLAAARQL